MLEVEDLWFGLARPPHVLLRQAALVDRWIWWSTGARPCALHSCPSPHSRRSRCQHAAAQAKSMEQLQICVGIHADVAQIRVEVGVRLDMARQSRGFEALLHFRSPRRREQNSRARGAEVRRVRSFCQRAAPRAPIVTSFTFRSISSPRWMWLLPQRLLYIEQKASEVLEQAEAERGRSRRPPVARAGHHRIVSPRPQRSKSANNPRLPAHFRSRRRTSRSYRISL